MKRRQFLKSAALTGAGALIAEANNLLRRTYQPGWALNG